MNQLVKKYGGVIFLYLIFYFSLLGGCVVFFGFGVSLLNSFFTGLTLFLSSALALVIYLWKLVDSEEFRKNPNDNPYP